MARTVSIAFSNSDREQYTSEQFSHACTLASPKGLASLCTAVADC